MRQFECEESDTILKRDESKYMNIESEFNIFMKNQIRDISKETIDYIGINICEKKDIPTFKIYYSEKYSKKIEGDFYDFLYMHDMIRCYEMIADSSKNETLRIDYAIKNRVNNNMRLLIKKLTELFEICSNNRDILENMLKMKVSDDKNYKMASLYHVGLVYKEKILQMLKLYFFCSWCSNPEKPNIDRIYKDIYFVEFLMECHIDQYRRLSEIVTKILNKTNAHLWMVGCDCGLDKNKYKIYLKKVDDYGLGELFDGCKYTRMLNKQLESIDIWRESHKEYKMTGIAVGLDENQVFSLNTYYMPK